VHLVGDIRILGAKATSDPVAKFLQRYFETCRTGFMRSDTEDLGFHIWYSLICVYLLIPELAEYLK